MKANNNVPQPLDDEALGESTGGILWGIPPVAATLENPIGMKVPLEEVICTRCKKIRQVPVDVKQCSCGGKLEKHSSSAPFIATL